MARAEPAEPAAGAGPAGAAVALPAGATSEASAERPPSAAPGAAGAPRAAVGSAARPAPATSYVPEPPAGVVAGRPGDRQPAAGEGTAPTSPAAHPVPVHVYGHHAVVGPFPAADPAGGAPGSPCPRCLARRWQTVRSGALRHALEKGGGTRAVGEPPWTVPFLTDAMAALIAAERERRPSERRPSERPSERRPAPGGPLPAATDRTDPTATTLTTAGTAEPPATAGTTVPPTASGARTTAVAGVPVDRARTGAADPDSPTSRGAPPSRGTATDATAVTDADGPTGAATPAAGARQAEARPGGAPAADPFAPVCLLDLENLHVSRFPLIPDAECPHCDPRVDDTADAATITLEPSRKRAPDEFRLRDIDGYHLPLAAFVNPIAGMLGSSVVPNLVSESTSSVVGSFTMRSGSYLRDCYWGGHTPAYRRSVRVGLLEGLERFAGMRARGKRTRVVASWDELGAAGLDALDPRDCGVYADEFHAREPAVRPFSPSRPIPWVWGYSLRDHRPLLVPEILAYYHSPGGLADRFVQESSNGCASGGSLAEAVYFGLMEAVERDAFLIAWYGRAALPEIDPRTSRRAETRAMVDRLAMYGYRARFFDTRISFPIPVVTAVAERIDGGLGALCFGAGASLDPEAALAAGLCEIATDAVNLRRRTVRDLDRLTAMARDFDRVRVLHDHPLVYGLPEMARHADFLLADRAGDPGPAPLAERYRDLPAPRADLRDDLRWCLDAVTGAGFDVVVVDQTVPEQRGLGLHTVGVLVPGLVPIDFGWLRQRARHMPRVRTALREAGRRATDLRDDDLNPAPHPFP